MKLIIAEKPSLARNIIAAIGNMKKQNGFYSGGEYLVTWAFGHLFSLADVEDYLPEDKRPQRWTADILPCYPESFVFKLRKDESKRVDSGVLNQFETIKALCNREDVDTLINAGDSDREGEIIIRICINEALKGQKRFLRLWLPDQTEQTVREALATMKDESEYDNLANEGLARTYIDWLYGVNLTRFATLKTGKLLRVGRVIVPVVKAIYDRDMQIKHFVPEKYFAPVSKTGNENELIELTSKQKFSATELDKCQELCNKYNSLGLTVSEVKRKKEVLTPGKLYSLSKLQSFLGKKYKMNMSESLEVVQKLYEEGYVTYPRTNSEYLATAEQDKIKTILANVKKLGYPVEFKFKKTIFDDSKIESHSALTPTYKIPDKQRLTEREMLVYQAIFKRFVAVFCSEDCLIDRTQITLNAGDLEEFSLKGASMKQAGWTKYDFYTPKDKFLPPLKKGDVVQCDFKPVEKETTPPKHYTIETLNNYLKNPFKDDKAKADKENDEDDYKAIFEGLELGTEATRTGIIDNARKSGYILLKNDTYTILPDGEYLIEALRDMNISMDKYKTSQLGQALKKVYKGEMTIDSSLEMAKSEISAVIKPPPCTNPMLDTDNGFFMERIGTCPFCGSDIVKSRFNFGCMGYKEKNCSFSIPGRLAGRIISKQMAKELLENKKTGKVAGFVSKIGRPFDAALILTEDKKIKFSF
ncbi:MAG: DNA topoisomerase III [Ruminococcaceae bacterium]|nr:DNA topoisomerase III [Oscillospiraceae bacterium]